MRLKDKVALITGASRGIGRGIAEIFAEEGAHVAVNYVNSAGEAEHVAEYVRSKGRRAMTVKADVANRADVEPMVDRVWNELGPIDILVNNAGIETIVPFLELTDDQWTRLTDVNLRGNWLCSQVYCRRAVADKRPGSIVNIGSIQAAKVLPGRTHYAPTKLGLEALTRNMSAEMTPLGIRVNCVHPGLIDTDMTEWVMKSPEILPVVLGQISLGRAGQPREIGTVVSFFASDEASYLTGQSVHVDGGWAGKEPGRRTRSLGPANWNRGGAIMGTTVDRRTFTRTLAVAVAGTAMPSLHAQKARRLKAGHTGITWGFSPADAEPAIKDVAALGFQGYESFGNVLEAWEAKGGLKTLLDAAGLPLHSAYCPVNLTEPAQRQQEIAKIVRWAGLIRKCGGAVAVIGPNNVKRPEYVFADHKAAIVQTLNDMGKALQDTGVIGALHQHTGTCVETRDETYAVMQAVDTRYVKFGPDVGQLQKGGADPVQVVKDFLPAIRHVHLKDFDGGPDYLGYCPLGQGKVDVAAIVDLLDGSGNDMMIMAELDPSPKMPLTPLDAARVNKTCLQKLGYAFRT